MLAMPQISFLLVTQMKLKEDISMAANGPQNPRAWAEAGWRWGAQPDEGREAVSDACFSDARRCSILTILCDKELCADRLEPQTTSWMLLPPGWLA